MLQPLCDEKELTVRLHLCPELPNVSIDVDRINQVVYNILNNAIRYINRGDTIAVTTERAVKEGKEYVLVSIADTGNGISPEDLPYIFQYFYRGEKSRSRKSGGSGIGLALAKQFVVSHGGLLDVESEVGKGTTFYIYLPLG